MSIGEYCQRDVRTIDVGASLREAARRMADEGVGCLVAVQGTAPRGVLTDRDLAMRVLREGIDPDQGRVADVLAEDPLVVHAASPLRAASALMRRRAVRRLPVLDEQERLVGVIALDDLLGLLARELAGLADAVAAQAPRAGATTHEPETGPEVE
jgi:CBS domain-containing protein